MSFRRKIERKIREKQEEIEELRLRLREAETYIQAMSDVLRLVPKDASEENLEEGSTVKPGTAMEAVLHVLREQRRPMHIMELLPAIGREATAEQRASIASTISQYVRRNQLFTRTGPNTFGLLEWAQTSDEPPADFGVTHQ